MIVKTITTYDVYNYGASLQAYALQQYLISLGNEVEIIRYQPDYLSRKYDYRWVNPESRASKYILTRIIYRVAKYLHRQTTLKGKHAFDKFNHNILKETHREYHSFKELCENPPQADLYICGSDQIWNVLHENGRDPAFFLEFVKYGKRISYAASFSYLDINNEHLKRIQKSLKKFDAVSVREYHGLNILKNIGIQGTWVLDPVFLLSREQWFLFSKKGCLNNLDKRDKYLLIYDFEGNDVLKKCAISYAKKHSLKIVAIVDNFPILYANKNFMGAGPLEFVQLISNCEAFMSNSFHGTAFSIIFHKKFWVFERLRQAVNSRMESLLALFEMDNVLITSTEQFVKAECFNFNWEKTDMIAMSKLKESEDFIKRETS